MSHCNDVTHYGHVKVTGGQSAVDTLRAARREPSPFGRGQGEGALLIREKPSPQPSPSGRGIGSK